MPKKGSTSLVTSPRKMEHCNLEPYYLAKSFPLKTPKTAKAATILALDFTNEVEAVTKLNLKLFWLLPKKGSTSLVTSPHKMEHCNLEPYYLGKSPDSRPLRHDQNGASLVFFGILRVVLIIGGQSITARRFPS